MRRSLRATNALIIPIVACASALVACQAPGFMGLNQDAALGPTRPDERIVRVRFRVLLPEALCTGMSVQSIPSPEATQGGWTTDERSLVGVKIPLEGQKTPVDFTDEQGIATLGLPAGRVIPIRADFNTRRGPVSLTTLAWASADALHVPNVLVSLPAALITSRLATRHPARDLARLDREQFLESIRILDARMRDETGHFDSTWLPSEGQSWGMADLAAWLIRLDPLLTDLTRGLILPADTAHMASPSASSSLYVYGGESEIPVASASPETVTASPSRTLSAHHVASWRLADLGIVPDSSWEGSASSLVASKSARFERRLGAVTRRGPIQIFRGTDFLITPDATHSWNFLVRVAPGRVKWAYPGRPAHDLNWPLQGHSSLPARIDLPAPGISGATESYVLGVGPSELVIQDPRSRQIWRVEMATPSVAPARLTAVDAASPSLH